VDEGDGEFQMSKKGERWLRQLGIDLRGLGRRRRKVAPLCVYWSERKNDIGGALGAALATNMLDESWITREQDSPVLIVTSKGKVRLKTVFGIRWETRKESYRLSGSE
jgi:hypothetical protein